MSETPACVHKTSAHLAQLVIHVLIVQLCTTKLCPTLNSSPLNSSSPILSAMPSRPPKQYFVEAILDHKSTSDGRLFLVKWRGYSAKHNSWEPETNFPANNIILNQYLADKDLCESPDLNDTLETLPDISSNFKAVPDVLRYINCWTTGTPSYSAGPPIAEYLGRLPSYDSILVLLKDCHFYIIMHLPQQSVTYIVDGANTSLERKSELERYLGHPLTPLAFHQQRKVDHCASSAVALSLEFCRLYKSPEELADLEEMRVPSKWLAFLAKKMHPEQSENLKGWTPIADRWQKLRCPYCPSKTFKNRSAMASHQRLAKCKEANQ